MQVYEYSHDDSVQALLMGAPISCIYDEAPPSAGAIPITVSPAVVSQPAPVPSDETPIVDLVVRDFQERLTFGKVKHETPPTINNGRDHLMSAYQECLDMAIDLRAEIEQRRTGGQNG